MRLSVEQDALEQTLKAIAPAVQDLDYEDHPKGTALPILVNVLLKTEAARMMVAASNLELTIITFIGAKIDNPGEILLPFKLFQELVSHLSPERVDLLLDDKKQKLNIKCGSTNSNMQGTLTTQYPTLPAAPYKFDLSVDAGIFLKAVKEVAYAADNRLMARPTLRGIHLITQEGQLRFEAANEWRMAIQNIPADITIGTAAIIPVNTLKVAAKLAEKAETVQIAVADGKVYFEIGKTLVIGQTLEGIFPDVQRLIPNSFLTNLRVCREEFQKALRRAEIFAKDNDYYARIVATDTLVDVSTQGSERGDLIGSIDTELVGETLEVGVNIKYIQQALSAITTEWVLISGNDPKKPIIIKPEGETAVHFIAPMNLR